MGVAARMCVLAMALLLNIVTAEPREYCQSSYFNATCSPRSVLIMISASYGRIRSGTCITGSYGQIGCSVDVRDFMDRKCSGRRHCSVYISEPELHERNPCSRDFAVYLEADYSCVKGMTSSMLECSQKSSLKLTQPSGYLTSLEAIESGYGTRLCPWVIKAKHGQIVKITYYNFGGSSSACYEVATIEGAADDPKTLTTCGKRDGVVYESSGGDVTVSFFQKEVLRKMNPFVLYYEVAGCAHNIPAPPGGYIKYENNMATVKCNHSEETWFLTCAGNKWNGDRGNCSKSKDISWTFKQTLAEGSDSFPYGILIVVAIGVALGVFIGGLVLSFVYFYMKRKRNPYQEPPQADQQLQQQDYYQSGVPTLKKQPPHSPPVGVLVARDSYPQVQFEDRDHVCSVTGGPHAHEGYYSTKSKNFGVQRVYDACASSAQRSGHVYERPEVS